MTKYLQGIRADCDTWKAAIDTDAGMPSCAGAQTFGGPDRLDRTKPGPGWTITVTPAVIAVDASTAALEVPDDQLPRLGRRGVPTLAQAKDVAALPAPLLTAVRDAKGLQPDGTPKPFPFGTAKADSSAQKEGLLSTAVESVRSLFVAPESPAQPEVVASEATVRPWEESVPAEPPEAVPAPPPEPVVMGRRTLLTGIGVAAATLAAAGSILFAVTTTGTTEESIDAGQDVVDAAAPDAGD